MKQDNRKTVGVFLIVGLVLIMWCGLLIAPLMKDGLIGIITGFPDVIEHPFHIKFCEDSVKATNKH